MAFWRRKSRNPSSTASPVIVFLRTLLFPAKLIIPLFSTGADHVLTLDEEENNATSAFAGLYSSNFNFFVNIQKYMTRKSRSNFLITLLALFVFAVCSLRLSRNALSDNSHIFLWGTPEFSPISRLMVFPDGNINHLVSDSDVDHVHPLSHSVASVVSIKVNDSVAVLMPDWEILMIVSPEGSLSIFDYGKEYVCLFQNNATSPAKFSGVLLSTGMATLRCEVPKSVKRIRPFFQPILIGKTLGKEPPPQYPTQAVELYRWSFLTYDSYCTNDDVVLFVKGINNRQGVNRPPNELRCVFDDGFHRPVKTTVTSSVQEVFRCERPHFTGFGFLSKGRRIKVSLELVNENLVVPSVAYYTNSGRLGLAKPEEKKLVCACTMVHNVAKFLREWVMYHAKIGVDKFILYDNNSDDNLAGAVKELVDQGYDVRTVFWTWPKTQEAGFSHSALYARDMCNWMMYLDVDEFVFSPMWKDIKQPSKTMLPSLLPTIRENSDDSDDQPSSEGAIGQVSFKCYDFGPSGQKAHPGEGVIQGYTCRRRFELRHKSIVLLEAVDRSLSNVIHHFEVDQERFVTKQVSKNDAVVNHYKYQAWPEFRTKFRRRVSAYVADWTEAVNPASKDRTPGLGFKAVEPKGWANKFCDVRDDRLKLLTANWFRECRMAWQR